MHVISRENFLIMYVVFNYNLNVRKGEINYSFYPETGKTQNMKLIEDALENILPTIQFKRHLRAQPPDELLRFPNHDIPLSLKAQCETNFQTLCKW